MGICFVGLGAMVMFDSGIEFSNKGNEFAGQLIELYTSNLGEAWYGVIAIAALTTMISTTITTLDASPRVMSKTIQLLFQQKNKDFYMLWITILGIGNLLDLSFFTFRNGTINSNCYCFVIYHSSFLRHPKLSFDYQQAYAH